MKSRLIWRKSWNNNHKDSFWIECTDQEVIDNILPLKSDADFLESIKNNRGHSLINNNENESVFCNFFLISVDLKDIESFQWVYPYSGLWNAYNPFERIDLVDFNKLEQLKDIFKKLGKIEVNTQRIWGTQTIRNGVKRITPDYYNWDYCCKNRMPYINVTPKVKYAEISYDMLTIEKGLAFEDNHEFFDVWEKIYWDYAKKRGLEEGKAFFSGSTLQGQFTIFKCDTPVMLELLFQKIETHIKKHGIIDLEQREKYAEIERLNNELGE